MAMPADPSLLHQTQLLTETAIDYCPDACAHNPSTSSITLTFDDRGGTRWQLHHPLPLRNLLRTHPLPERRHQRPQLQPLPLLPRGRPLPGQDRLRVPRQGPLRLPNQLLHRRIRQSRGHSRARIRRLGWVPRVWDQMGEGRERVGDRWEVCEEGGEEGGRRISWETYVVVCVGVGCELHRWRALDGELCGLW